MTPTSQELDSAGNFQECFFRKVMKHETPYYKVCRSTILVHTLIHYVDYATRAGQTCLSCWSGDLLGLGCQTAFMTLPAVVVWPVAACVLITTFCLWGVRGSWEGRGGEGRGGEGRGGGGEQNGANFSSIAPSSEEL